MPEYQTRIEPTYPFRLSHHGEGEVDRAFWVRERPCVFLLSQEGADAPVDVRVFSSEELAGHGDALDDAARRCMSADDDLGEFAAAVEGDPPMHRLAKRYPGLKPLRSPDLWTALLRGIVTRGLHGAQAWKRRDKLAKRMGATVEADGRRWHLLPRPGTIADGDPELVWRAGVPDARVTAVQNLARSYLDGELREDELEGTDDREKCQSLGTFKGVGRWVAETTVIFGLGGRDLFPAEDARLRRAIGHLYHLPHMPTEAEAGRIAERWEGWRSYAAIYLWRALGDEISG